VKNAKITIKNYRGFGDQEPAIFEIGEGFTAFLGKNNAGKSSAKLVFYELRPLFVHLAQVNPQQHPGLAHMMQGATYSIQYPAVSDPEELFNNSNNRPITIEIEVVGAATSVTDATVLRLLVLKAERSSPHQWTCTAYGTVAPEDRLNSPNGWAERIPNIWSNPQGTLILDLQDMHAVLDALTRSRYYGSFRNAINVGASDYFDLKTGTAFIDLWNSWKTSGIKSQNRAIGQITEDIRRLFEFSQLEINASTGLHTLVVTIDQHTYRLPELGSGIAQFIMVLGNAATAKPSIIFIDEPETNLHPSLQIDFLLALAQYTTVGCVFSTHSVGLARSVAQRIYSFKKGACGAIIRSFEATPNFVEFLGELSFSTFKEMGHDRLLLVEGVNDVKTVQQFLRLFGKEHTTVILPLGGNQLAAGGREQELNELTRLSSNICALVDSERTAAASSPTSRRKAFAETCRQLGFSVCVTERRALENYFTDAAIKAAFGETFSALDPYQLLKDGPNVWRKSDSWKVARHMTKDDLAGTDLGNFIEQI
jgi:energy-coupling factor transporter ATP-binding protein EcfA2